MTEGAITLTVATIRSEGSDAGECFVSVAVGLALYCMVSTPSNPPA